MLNDLGTILDALLGEWHNWARGYSPVPTCGAVPMFRNAKSSKGWDSAAEVVEDELSSKTMQAVDFHVGELQEPYRSAIYAHARNCHTGRKVWSSPRLPVCPMERGLVLAEAKNMIARRLLSAGVI